MPDAAGHRWFTAGAFALVCAGASAGCGSHTPSPSLFAAPEPRPAVAAIAANATPLSLEAPSSAGAEARRAGTEVRLLVAGDVLPHRPRLSSPERIALALAPMEALFQQADLVVANYETATGDPEKLGDRRLVYAASPEWMDAVRRANIGALTLANNHACDLGARGLERSIDAADALGEIGLGAARDEAGPWAPRTLLERDGHRVCGIAWTTFVNSRGPACARGRMLAVAPLGRRGEAQVARSVRAARGEGCDAVVAIFHGGLEYAPQVRPAKAQAAAAAEAGADAVIIHHPHVASVGNLVSNQGESWKPSFPAAQRDRHLVYMNGWTRLGVVADLAFRFRDASPRAEVAWGYHLVWTENGHADDKADPMPRVAVRPVDRDADRAILEKLAKDKTGPGALFADPCWIESGAPRCR